MSHLNDTTKNKKGQYIENANKLIRRFINYPRRIFDSLSSNDLLKHITVA